MAAEENEDVKPKINLVVEFEGQTCTIKVKSGMAFKKVFEAAEKRFGKEPGTFKFHFEGVRLNPESTPAEMSMEDGDTIDAHLQQLGGGGRPPHRR
ncbi:Ubiquitin-like protein [Sparassis crispa]|uniref:Ubiquitin-like protein n=1 Tax=Sparassis crispa TaxID=139825 RepID=A0A401GUF6_9APHY|nr:Ubiquitin-like protein [Sparassis crispa]GBE85867.1 Ubiquitin-like protein [Sparassis crispa]